MEGGEISGTTIMTGVKDEGQNVANSMRKQRRLA